MTNIDFEFRQGFLMGIAFTLVVVYIFMQIPHKIVYRTKFNILNHIDIIN